MRLRLRAARLRPPGWSHEAPGNRRPREMVAPADRKVSPGQNSAYSLLRPTHFLDSRPRRIRYRISRTSRSAKAML